MFSTKIKILFAFLFIAFSVNGQIYNFQHLSVENGFPQANADDIIQDHQGFIWIATQVGAVRFDGQNYEIYNEKNGVASHLVSRIYCSSKNEIWIGTREGLSVKKRDTVISYYQKDGLPGNRIEHIWEDNYNTLWIMTDGGLVYFTNNEFIEVSLPIGDQIIKNHFSHNNDLYLSTNKGVLIQTGKYQFEKTMPEFSEYIIEAIVFQKDTIWVATFQNGLFKSANRKTRQFNNQSILKSNTITSLLLDSNNKLWVGTEGNGFFLREKNTFTPFSDKNGMHNTSVLKLSEDVEGNIWAGGRNGVIIYNPYNPFRHYREANQRSEETLFGMLQDKNGIYWFTTYGAGLSKFDGNSWTYYTKDDGLIDNRLFKIIEDKQHNKWIATSGHGVIKYNGKYFTTFDANNKFISDRIFTIIFDKKERLWGGSSNHGPFMFDGYTFTTYANSDSVPKTIMSCIEDTLGQIWFGSVGNGLVVYNGHKFLKPIITGEIQPTYIRSLALDSTGNIWLGSASEGVCRLIKTGDNQYSLISINRDRGLNSNNVYFVMADDKNQIWAGTEKGINKIILNKKQEIVEIQSYGRTEGFIGAETGINGAMIDNKGKLWFSSLIGATCYEPGIEKQNKIEPKTHITDLKLFYQKTNWKNYVDSLNENDLPINLSLTHKNNHLTFSFIGLSFTNSKKVKYTYKLKGLDKAWSPISNKTEAVYANIPPGRYTFMVKSSNNNGIWNKKPTTFSFEIEAPFWQKTWFYLLSVIILATVIFFYVQMRISSLKKAKITLAQKVKERTSEIEAQKQEIQEKNEELNQRTEEIAAQRDELNEQNIKIEKLFDEQTQSIKYAKHIQEAVLSSKEPLNKHFNDYFILFKPHSIVSGDFYYVAEVREWVIIAAVDSTGHGVPGGFMSMLGMSFLNEIVYPMEEIQSDVILNKLRKYIIRSLKQAGNPGEQKEGMEMSITAINTKTCECQFTGAQNPIFLIRSNNNPKLGYEIVHQDDEKTMYLLPPDNMPISIFPKMDPFTKHQFKLYKGDKIYYFSDGYIDQFGGENGKKLSKKTFNELIFKTSALNMSKQQQELETFYLKWKGTFDKIDDVLVMGIEV